MTLLLSPFLILVFNTLPIGRSRSSRDAFEFDELVAYKVYHYGIPENGRVSFIRYGRFSMVQRPLIFSLLGFFTLRGHPMDLRYQRS